MLRRVLVTYALAQSFASAAAWACLCTGPDHSEDDAVFVGTVRGTGLGCGGLDSATTFAVEDACFGDMGATITIDHNRGGANCGTTFEPGTRMLVFAEENSTGNLVTSMCAGNTDVIEPTCEANGL